MSATAETTSNNLYGMVAACEAQWGGPLYLTQEAADIIEVHKLTVIRWRKKGVLKPTHTYHRKQQVFPLYTQDDIIRGLVLKDSTKPGPEPGFKLRRKVHVSTKEAHRGRTR